jgi:surface antigen
MHRQTLKPGLAAVLAVLATLTTLIVGLPAASASPTYYVTSSDGVYARSGPHQADVTGYGPGYGAAVTYLCWLWGDSVGPYSDRLWYNVSWSGGTTWINDHWLSDPEPANTPVPGVPECGAQTTPQTGAINYARQYLGQSYDSGECLAFVAAAYQAAGISIGGAVGAAQYWSSDPESYTRYAGNTSPSVGALVFWGATSSNPYGHVGIYEGDNTVISTSSWPEPVSDPDVHEWSFSGRNGAGYPYLGFMVP